MKISEIMTKCPATCGSETSAEEIARFMMTRDCGSIPVLDGNRVIGIVTDRDIVLRAVAAGRLGSEVKAGELMSHPVVSIQDGDTVCAAMKVLEKNQIKRAPVVDSTNSLVGMVSQADLVRASETSEAGELVQSLSQGFDSAHMV